MLQAGAIGGSHPATLSERSSCRSNLVEHARVRKLHVLGDGRLASDACAHAYTQACRDKRARINTHAQHTRPRISVLRLARISRASQNSHCCEPLAPRPPSLPSSGDAQSAVRLSQPQGEDPEPICARSCSMQPACRRRSRSAVAPGGGCAQPFGLQGSRMAPASSQPAGSLDPPISSSVTPCTHRECCSCCCRCRRSCRRGPCAPGRRSCRRSRAACAADGSRPAHPDARRRKPHAHKRSRTAAGSAPAAAGQCPAGARNGHTCRCTSCLSCAVPRPAAVPPPPLRLWERCLTCMIANCVKSHGVIIRFVAFDSRAANTSVFPQPPA
jgi:hypothetical protein